MVATTVMVRVKPEHVDAFILATVKNHERSILEEGNKRFDILQRDDDPTSFLLYEAYDSKESTASHKQTTHYAEWRDRVAEMMAEPRKSIHYKSIKP